MTDLASRVKEARESMKPSMSPSALSKALGLTRSAVSQIEDGTTKSLKVKTAFKLQDLTGYSARYVVLGEGPKKVIVRPEDAIPTEVLELARNVATMGKAERKLLMKIFKERGHEAENIPAARVREES